MVRQPPRGSPTTSTSGTSSGTGARSGPSAPAVSAAPPRPPRPRTARSDAAAAYDARMFSNPAGPPPTPAFVGGALARTAPFRTARIPTPAACTCGRSRPAATTHRPRAPTPATAPRPRTTAPRRVPADLGDLLADRLHGPHLVVGGLHDTRGRCRPAAPRGRRPRTRRPPRSTATSVTEPPPPSWPPPNGAPRSARPPIPPSAVRHADARRVPWRSCVCRGVPGRREHQLVHPAPCGVGGSLPTANPAAAGARRPSR